MSAAHWQLVLRCRAQRAFGLSEPMERALWQAVDELALDPDADGALTTQVGLLALEAAAAARTVAPVCEIHDWLGRLGSGAAATAAVVCAYLAPNEYGRRAAIMAVLDRTPVWMADLALAEMEGASLALVYAAKCLADEHVWGAALRVCAAAAWFAQAGPDDVRWGHIALTAGEVAWQQGRWALAREQFELAAALLADAPSWQSRAEVGLAMTLLVMGELAEADSMAFSALSRARLAGRTTAWAERVLLWIRVWQAAMATSPAAAAYHREAALDRLATMGSTDVPGRPAALVELGLAFLGQQVRGGRAGDDEGRRLAGEGLRRSHDERGARWCLSEGPPEPPPWWGELELDGLPLAVCDAWMATPFATDEVLRFVEADRMWGSGDPGWMALFF